MPRLKVEFKNNAGQTLAGALELPDQGQPRAMALFAHCFTCGKDVVAASRIARELGERGIAVLRFDFTGLGGSDGDFASTTFSTNVSDLEAAAQFLAQSHEAPRLIIGHSLGGAAALVAARRINSIEAVVTIAAPSTPQHVKHLFKDKACDISSDGQADVCIGDRDFVISAELLADLEQWPLERTVGDLNKPLLIFHSPLDQVVGIDEAGEIYDAALHPKSFISLDDADHLLTRAADAEYVAVVIGAWASRYLDG